MKNRAQRIHLQKLESIANRGNPMKQKSSAAMSSIDGQERFFRNKQRIHQYKQSVKQAEIERDNQKLLKKLVEISAGRKAPINAPPNLGKSQS